MCIRDSPDEAARAGGARVSRSEGDRDAGGVDRRRRTAFDHRLRAARRRGAGARPSGGALRNPGGEPQFAHGLPALKSHDAFRLRAGRAASPVSYTNLRAKETELELV